MNNDQKTVNVGPVPLGGGHRLALIAGPCVIESRDCCFEIAAALCELADTRDIPLIFKASYDKANRTSHKSFRGPGLEKGLMILAEVKARYNIPVLTDVHAVEEVALAADVVDMLQLPAFLCRQTDLVEALGACGKPVNVKKAQFMAPWDIHHVIAKLENQGSRAIALTERGVSFGYGNLVADMRSLLIMQESGYPVVFDATHSVQQPSAAGDQSGGDSRWAPYLARAAVATGCDAIFMETHPRPDAALSDKANCVMLSKMDEIWRQLTAIDAVVRGKNL